MKIAVTGGKGGTGKSTIATALAHELAKKQEVLLIDADVDCPNDHLILNVERQKVKDIRQVIPSFDLGKCTKCGRCGEVCKFNAIASVKGNFPIFIQSICNGCQACLISCPVEAISKTSRVVGEIFEGKKGNLKLVSAQIKPRYFGSAFVVGKELEYAKEEGITILDTAAGTHCNVIEAIYEYDDIIAVTEPTPLGAHDLELILKLLRRLGKKAMVVINRSDIGDKSLIEAIIKEYGATKLADIPYSKKFIEAYSKGEVIMDKNIKKIIAKIK